MKIDIAIDVPILDFLGLEVDNFPDKSAFWIVDRANQDPLFHNSEECLFQTSCKWRQAVVDKINSLGYTVQETFSDSQTFRVWSRPNTLPKYWSSDETLIEAITKFAVWYNSLHKPQ